MLVVPPTWPAGALPRCVFNGAYGGENVAGLGLFAAGEGCRLRLCRRCRRSGWFVGAVREAFRGKRVSVAARRDLYGAAVYGGRRRRSGGRGFVREGIEQRPVA